MSLYKQFSTNKEKENTGVSISYGFNEEGQEISFIVCRMGRSNKAYQKALDAAIKPYTRQIQLGVMDETLAEKIEMEVFVDSVLKGWCGVTNSEGKTMPFNKSNAIKLFTDLPELYQDLKIQASSASLFNDFVKEEEAKN